MFVKTQNGFQELLLFIVLMLMIISSCKKAETTPEIRNYSFFIAGHTYGMPGVDNAGLHPPFQEKFSLINDRNMELGFLTGDIVKQSTEKDWDDVDSVLKQLDAAVYFAVGNHDVTNRTLYENRYGKTYLQFTYQNDLFIILDPNIDGWNISGQQFSFLEETLQSVQTPTTNIFIFFHQLIWWDKNTKYKSVRLNSHEGKADSLNYWTEIEPLFNKYSNPIYLFAGDLGAGNWSDDVMYDQYDNITMIASGMGEGPGDNFVVVNVDASKQVSFELIALNEDDINAMGKLEDYIVP